MIGRYVVLTVASHRAGPGVADWTLWLHYLPGSLGEIIADGRSSADAFQVTARLDRAA